MEEAQLAFSPAPACRGSKGQLLPNRRAGKAGRPPALPLQEPKYCHLVPSSRWAMLRDGQSPFQKSLPVLKGCVLRCFHYLNVFHFISDRSVSYTKVQETPRLHHAAEDKPG